MTTSTQAEIVDILDHCQSKQLLDGNPSAAAAIGDVKERILRVMRPDMDGPTWEEMFSSLHQRIIRATAQFRMETGLDPNAVHIGPMELRVLDRHLKDSGNWVQQEPVTHVYRQFTGLTVRPMTEDGVKVLREKEPTYGPPHQIPILHSGDGERGSESTPALIARHRLRFANEMPRDQFERACADEGIDPRWIEGTRADWLGASETGV